MCTSTAPVSQAAVHEHGSDNILSLYVARMDIARRSEDTWCEFGMHYDSFGESNVRLTALGPDSPPWQNFPPQIFVNT
jgi:hypothetical protein